MKILTISNLFPRPDQPQRGLFNAQLFHAMAGELARGKEQKAEGKGERAESGERRAGVRCQDGTPTPPYSDAPALLNVCLVPEWRVWRWARISGFRFPSAAKASAGKQVSGLPVVYLPVFYLPIVGRSVSGWTYGWTMRRLKRMADDCDAVFSTWLYPDGVAATRLAAACDKPSWIMVQGSDTFHLEHAARRRAILDACAHAAGIVCVWQGLADRLIAAGVEKRKIHVVPNGVDQELFRWRTKDEAWPLIPEVRSQKSGVRIDQKVALFVGNLVPVKGPDVLLRAWKVLQTDEGGALKPERETNIEHPTTPTLPHSHTPILVFIGSGPMRGELEKQARDLGIADSVVFLGSRPHEDVALWMNVADCLCLPSRAEGMPNVVLEALASGLPVVATGVGAVREMLAGEPGARVVEAGEYGGVGVWGCGSGGKQTVSDERGTMNETSSLTEATEGRHRTPNTEHRTPNTEWSDCDAMPHAPCALPSDAQQLPLRLAAALAEVLAAPIDRVAMAERNSKLRSWNQMAESVLSLLESGRIQEGEARSVR